MVGVFNVGLVQIITLIKKKFLYVHKYANFNINHLKINACKYFKKEKKTQKLNCNLNKNILKFLNYYNNLYLDSIKQFNLNLLMKFLRIYSSSQERFYREITK